MVKPARGSMAWKLIRRAKSVSYAKKSPRLRKIGSVLVRIPRRLLIPPHQRHAKGFFIEERDNWTYEDHAPQLVSNGIIKAYRRAPHIVLRDRNQNARFVLQYEDYLGVKLTLKSIQRERTRQAYVREGKEMRWDNALETQRSREFQTQLGMHPAEFLMSEFIFRHRKEIRDGKTLQYFHLPMIKNPGIYKPLLDRFFRKKGAEIGPEKGQWYELNPNRRRVKELLEIQ